MMWGRRERLPHKGEVREPHIYGARNCLAGGIAGFPVTTDILCPPCEDLRVLFERLRSRQAQK